MQINLITKCAKCAKYYNAWIKKRKSNNNKRHAEPAELSRQQENHTSVLRMFCCCCCGFCCGSEKNAMKILCAQWSMWILHAGDQRLATSCQLLLAKRARYSYHVCVNMCMYMHVCVYLVVRCARIICNETCVFCEFSAFLLNIKINCWKNVKFQKSKLDDVDRIIIKNYEKIIANNSFFSYYLFEVSNLFFHLF